MLKKLNPYFLLGVSCKADDAEIQQAFEACLKVIRKEKDPEAEEIIQQAYEKIRTNEDRIRFDLFDVASSETSPLETLIQCARWMRRQNRLERLGMEDLRAFLGCLIGPRAEIPSGNTQRGVAPRRNQPRHPVRDRDISEPRRGDYPKGNSRRRPTRSRGGKPSYRGSRF
jgi:DnaJ-class molecular chaperone